MFPLVRYSFYWFSFFHSLQILDHYRSLQQLSHGNLNVKPKIPTATQQIHPAHPNMILTNAYDIGESSPVLLSVVFLSILSLTILFDNHRNGIFILSLGIGCRKCWRVWLETGWWNHQIRRKCTHPQLWTPVEDILMEQVPVSRRRRSWTWSWRLRQRQRQVVNIRVWWPRNTRSGRSSFSKFNRVGYAAYTWFYCKLGWWQCAVCDKSWLANLYKHFLL